MVVAVWQGKTVSSPPLPMLLRLSGSPPPPGAGGTDLPHCGGSCTGPPSVAAAAAAAAAAHRPPGDRPATARRPPVGTALCGRVGKHCRKADDVDATARPICLCSRRGAARRGPARANGENRYRALTRLRPRCSPLRAATAPAPAVGGALRPMATSNVSLCLPRTDPLGRDRAE